MKNPLKAISFKGRKMVCNEDQSVFTDIKEVVAHVAALHKTWAFGMTAEKLRWWDTSMPCTTRHGCTAGSGHPPPHNIRGTGHTGGQSCDKCGGGLCELYDEVHFAYKA